MVNPQPRRRISFFLLVIIGLLIGTLIKNVKAGMIIGIVIGILVSSFAISNKK